MWGKTPDLKNHTKEGKVLSWGSNQTPPPSLYLPFSYRDISDLPKSRLDLKLFEHFFRDVRAVYASDTHQVQAKRFIPIP